MNPNNNEERVCPRCGGTMKQKIDGTFKCVACGYEASEDMLTRGDSRE